MSHLIPLPSSLSLNHPWGYLHLSIHQDPTRIHIMGHYIDGDTTIPFDTLIPLVAPRILLGQPLPTTFVGFRDIIQSGRGFIPIPNKSLTLCYDKPTSALAVCPRGLFHQGHHPTLYPQQIATLERLVEGRSPSVL